MVTTTTTVTDVVTSTKAACTPACNFVATSGTDVGQYVLQASNPDLNTVSYSFVQFTPDVSKAGQFDFRPDGQVQSSDGVYGWITNGNSLYYILAMTSYSQSTYGVPSIKCSVTGPAPAGVPNASGNLSCQANLVTSPQTGNNSQVQSPDGDVAGVTPFTLAVVPVTTC